MPMKVIELLNENMYLRTARMKTQLKFTCSKSTKEKLEKGVKHAQS